MSKERMSIVDFGKSLIESEDLDPVYVALHNSDLSEDDIESFILAWLMYYHVGVACEIMQDDDIMESMMFVAEHNDEYPRGNQRKHHRKQPAMNCILDMIDKCDDAAGFASWCLSGGVSARSIFGKVCELVGWGPCMAWRVPDLYERLGISSVKFYDDDTDLFFSAGPLHGALLCCETYGLNPDPIDAHLYVMEHLGHIKAPPGYERTINIQETETIFCKWKSHMSGRYDIGRDTERSKQQLIWAENNNLAMDLIKTLPG